MSYKVGDRIRVFEILGTNRYGSYLNGLQRAEDFEFSQDSCGVSLVTKDIKQKHGFNPDFCETNFHFGIDYRRQAKHVCTMVITKLK